MKGLLPTLLLVLFTSPVAAQGWIEPAPAIRCTDCSVVRTRTEVSVRVVGRVARIQVDEWFQNRGGPMAQGDYLYPLPGEAVFSNFSLYQGEQELTGETMDADRARQIYEEIVRRKKDPALIELVGHGLIRARVFPFNSGETRKISLRYTQVLARAGQSLQFRYSVGRASDGSWIARPGVEVTRPVERSPFNFQLVADSAENFGEPFSPTHQIRTSRNGNQLVVRPEGTLSGDLSLFLPMSRAVVGLSAAMHRPDGEDGYFMLTLSPGNAREAQEPRDVTAVVDISGSMSGAKMTQARIALRQLLGSLNRNDRFRIVTFSSGVTSYRGDWTRATADEVSQAQSWVDGLMAEGGTNIAGALAEAFRAESPSDRLPIVLFMTDGLPSVGEQNPERIAASVESVRGRARVFAVGVGHDVNTYLLDRLSAAGRGATQYIQADGEVEGALSGLINKISHPVLTDLEIERFPASYSEVYPARLPDLFAGEELVVFGRYAGRNGRTGDLVITGRRNGRTERFSVELTMPEFERSNEFIPRLWASRKIGVLARAIRLEGHNPDLERQIRETALRYGILSEYTSYLVQEPEMVAQNFNRPMPVDRQRRALAPAPSAATGAGAVAAAAEARSLRDAKSEAELDQALGASVGTMQSSAPVKRVAGRSFARHGEVWTDGASSATLRTVTVEPFSTAYFEVLQRLPELKPYLAAMEAVKVSGVRVAVEFKAGGATRLSPAELDRLVADYRGR